MNKKYASIIRKSKLGYIAVCLELNLSAIGDTLAEVEINLRNAIELYLVDIKENPQTEVSPIPMDDFIEFLMDTEPESQPQKQNNYMLKPLELHEVAVYA